MSLFEGISFAISGNFGRDRETIMSLIEDNGGKLLLTIHNAHYLITNEEEIAIDTIKIQTARAYGIPFLSVDFIVDTIRHGVLPGSISDYSLKSQ